jgi:hypothetical protein
VIAPLTRNLVLLGVVVALGLTAYLTPPSNEDSAAVPLTGIDPKNVSRVEILRPGKSATVAVRDAQGWQLHAPLRITGNRLRLERIAQVARESSYAQYDLDPQQRPRYGLAEPAVTLRLNENELRFGDLEPLRGRRYVEAAGVLHVTRNVLSQVDLTVTELVSPRPFPPGSRLQALFLGELSLTRNEAAGWKANPPGPAASADAMQALADAWRLVRAIEVRETNDQGELLGTIRARFANIEGALDLPLTRDGDNLVLRRPDLGVEYRLPRDADARLLGLTEAPEGGDRASAQPSSTNDR